MQNKRTFQLTEEDVLRACQAVLPVAKVMISMPFQPPLKHVFDSVFRVLVSASFKAFPFNLYCPNLMDPCQTYFCHVVLDFVQE